MIWLITRSGVLHMRTAERFWNQVLIVLNYDLSFAWYLCPHTFESPMILLMLRYDFHDILLDKGFFLRPNFDLSLADGLLDMYLFPGDNIIFYRWRFGRRWFLDQNFCLSWLTHRSIRIFILFFNISIISDILYVDFLLSIHFIIFLVSSIRKVVQNTISLAFLF